MKLVAHPQVGKQRPGLSRMGSVLRGGEALAVYRVAQEATHNAIQHADASEIAVRLTEYPDRLRMTITDDGRGIPEGRDPRSFVAKGHFGLAGMRERAAMIGGTLDVHSAPDYGTAIILEIPAPEMGV